MMAKIRDAVYKGLRWSNRAVVRAAYAQHVIRLPLANLPAAGLPRSHTFGLLLLGASLLAVRFFAPQTARTAATAASTVTNPNTSAMVPGMPRGLPSAPPGAACMLAWGPTTAPAIAPEALDSLVSAPAAAPGSGSTCIAHRHLCLPEC